MELDPSTHRDSMHRIMTSIVTPRPIGWISTCTERRDNLAPFSYFNIVSTYPPAVMFSATFRDGERKDSTKMAIESGEFVVNLVTEELAKTMDKTSAPLGEMSEFDFVDIEREEAAKVDVPRVAGAAACLECTVYDSLDIYDSVVTIGTVEHIYIDEKLTTDGVIDMKKINSVGRVGGPFYTKIDLLNLSRQNFGQWKGDTPPGFSINKATGWLEVDREYFQSIQRAIQKIEDGEPVEEVATKIEIDQEELMNCLSRRDLYLKGKTNDERIEAALKQAGLNTDFEYSK